MTIDAANDTLNNPALENPETGETLQFTCPNPDCQGHNLLYKSVLLVRSVPSCL